MTLVIDSANLLIIRAKRTLKAADEYQRQFLSISPEWVRLDKFTKTTDAKELENMLSWIQGMTESIHSELNWFHFFFSGPGNGDWRAHMNRIKAGSLEMIADAKAKSWNSPWAKEKVRRFIELLQKEIETWNKVTQWDYDTVHAAILLMQELNYHTLFATFPAKVCFEKM